MEEEEHQQQQNVGESTLLRALGLDVPKVDEEGFKGDARAVSSSHEMPLGLFSVACRP